MIWGLTITMDGSYVFCRAISHIVFPAVLGIFLGNGFYVFVPVSFSKDGGCGDGRDLGVPLDDAFVG